MTTSPKEPIGSIWEDLDLSDLNQKPEGAQPLSWPALLPLLSEATEASPVDPLKLAVVYLDGLQDPDAALEHLISLGPEDHLANWLLLQAVLQAISPDLYIDRIWDRQKTAAADEASLAAGETALLQIFQGIQMETFLEEAQDWLSAGLPSQLARMIHLSARGEWDALASAFMMQSAVSRLMVAHLVGDRQGYVDYQINHLLSASEAAPLLTAETLLELCGEGDEELIATALEQRLQVLEGLGTDFTPHASATALLLKLRHPHRLPHLEVPSLRNPQASLAWHHMVSLVDRPARSPAFSGLAHRYMQEAEQCDPPLSMVLRIRAAEILMGQGSAGAAFNVLPTATADDLLTALVARYKVICLAQLRNWSLLSLELARFPMETEDLAEQASVLQLALLMAATLPEQSTKILQTVESQLFHLEPRFVLSLSGAILSGYRRLGDLKRVAALWTDLSLNTRQARQGSLAAFASGVTQLVKGQPSRALEAFGLANRHISEDLLTHIGRALALAENGQWPEAIEALHKLGRSLHTPARDHLLIFMARLTAVWGGRPDQALEFMEQVSSPYSNGVAALKEIAGIQLLRQRPEEALELLDRAIERAADSMERVDLVRLRGDIFAMVLEDPPRAEDAYRQAIAEHPLHPASLEGLRRLLTAQERFDELPSVLDSLLQLAVEDDDRLNIMLELSTFHRQRWARQGGEEDVEACLRYCDQALDLDPQNDQASRNIVNICVKRKRWQDIIDRLDITSPSLTSLRGLRKALQETGQWHLLAVVCQQLAEKSDNPRESMAAALRSGDIYRDQLDRPDTAEERYCWAAEHFPDPAALTRLASVLRGQQRWADLSQVLEEELYLTREERQRLKIHRELGRLYAGSLDNIRAARQHLLQAVELDPADISTRHTLEALPPLTLKELRETFKNSPLLDLDDPESLVELMLIFAQKTVSIGEACECLLQAAAVCTATEDRSRAQEIYRQILSRDPGSHRALEALSRIYEAEKKWSKLLAITRRQVELAQTPAAKAMLLFKCGALLEMRMDDPEEAEQFYCRATDACGDFSPAPNALRDLHARHQAVDRFKPCAPIQAHDTLS